LEKAREPDQGPPALALRILVVEHEELIRAGLDATLSGWADVSLAENPLGAEAAIDAARSARPDVLLLDADLPETDCVALMSQLHEASPSAVLVVMSSAAPAQRVLDFMAAGASAFLLKATDADQLRAAIERSLAGATFVSSEVAGEVVQALSRSHSTDGPESLTAREREVLAEVARGRSNREIGRDLEVAASTVKVHVERILRKLGAANRVEATTLGLQSGVIAADVLEPASRADQGGAS